MSQSGGQRPLVLILGAGLSGLTLATMLDPARLDVLVLEQDFPPGHSRQFHGVVTASDLAAVGLDPGQVSAIPIREVVTYSPGKGGTSAHPRSPGRGGPCVRPQSDAGIAIATTSGVEGWWAVEHGQLLGALRDLAMERGVTTVANREEVDLVWRQAELNGVRTRIGGLSFEADLVVFADESDPRLPESLGLRPDWLPTELMHLAKLRFDGAPSASASIQTFTRPASWGSTGYGMVVPGSDAVTVKVAMLLEDEMATARHISEYLDELLLEPGIADLVSGLDRGSFVTEVVPVGGFDRRHRFQRDRAIVASDLAGVTHPLNRDGLSTTLDLCRIAAEIINDSAAGSQIAVRPLDRYSDRIATAFPAEAKSRRRKDRKPGGQPAWQWFSLPELIEPAGVTSPPNDAKLSRVGSGLLARGRRRFHRP